MTVKTGKLSANKHFLLPFTQKTNSSNCASMYALKRIGLAYTHSDRAYINAHFGTLRAYAWTLELREELEICAATGAQSGPSIDEQHWACICTNTPAKRI